MFKQSALAFAVLALAAPAWAASETVDFTVDGQKVIGTLELPEGGPAPVIVLFHGFGGSRDELEIPSVKEGIFQRAAEAWAKQGFASLRIDFRGNGDSEGKFEDMTFSGLIADGLAAVDFVKADPRVDGSQIGIVGWSQGGLVASAVAARSATPIKAVALWAAVGEPQVTFTTLFGADLMAKAATTGTTPIEIKMPWGTSYFLKQSYFDEIPTTHPLEEIAKYAGPLFVAQGSNDPVVAPENGPKFIEAHNGPEELWVQPMDHSFNSFENVDTVDALIAATGQFMAANLD